MGSVGAAGLLSGPVAAVELSGARRPDEQGVQRRVCHGVGRGGGRHGADQVAGGEHVSVVGGGRGVRARLRACHLANVFRV